MNTTAFQSKLADLTEDVQNTNFDCIKMQMQLIFLVLEFYLGRKLEKQQIIQLITDFLQSSEYIDSASEAIIEVLSNMEYAHRCKNIFDDLGESYINDLQLRMKFMDKRRLLFNEP